VFLPFAATLRDVLESAQPRDSRSVGLARVAFAGGLVGITGSVMAILLLSGASTERANADPVVTKAIATAAVGPFLVAPMGFVAFLAATSLATIRSGVFPRWSGIGALLGAVSFAITFLITIAGTAEGSLFGLGFFAGFLALLIRATATSSGRYRAVTQVADVSAAVEARA
jgi:hypothetical protein